MSDLIERQAAIDAIENTDCELPSDAWDELTDAIMSVPSTQPERKTGKWRTIGNTTLAVCDCGFITDRYSAYKYCPNCGARMEGKVMIAPWNQKQTIVIDLDTLIIEVVKNGKHYGLNEYLEMAIDNLLDLRMKEDGNG